MIVMAGGIWTTSLFVVNNIVGYSYVATLNSTSVFKEEGIKPKTCMIVLFDQTHRSIVTGLVNEVFLNGNNYSNRTNE